MTKIRVAIADDHKVYAEALGTILESCPDPEIEVVTVAHTGNALLRALASRPDNHDIILLDLNMPDGDGLSVLPVIKKHYTDLRVLVLTMYDDAKFIKAVHACRGDGYFLKTNTYGELLTAIVRIMDGKPYFSAGLTVFPKDYEGNGNDNFQDDFLLRHNLTKRELEVLALISHAKSNKEIADELFISDQTVMVHRKNIMRKLSVTNTAGLIKFALDQNLS
jgi:DNA-binding NarL/FixJ family response regulator